MVYPCLVGIEVELEEIPAFPPPRRFGNWEFKEDPSLRGNSCGEFVFHQPLKDKEKIKDALQLLYEVVSYEGEVPFCSERTSVHVHLDMSYYTYDLPKRLKGKFIKNFLGYCVFLEPLWFAYFKTKYGVDRTLGVFCIPYQEATELFKRSLLNSTETGEWRYPRYQAINLDAIHKFGSIEFRHHPGEYKPQDILQWINALTRIVEISRESDVNQMENIPVYISKQGYKTFLETLNPKSDEYLEFYKYLSPHDIEACLDKGIVSSQELFELSCLDESQKIIEHELKEMTKRRLKRKQQGQKI